MLRRRQFERDVRDELEFHLAMQTEQNIARGMSGDAARAQAQREFGAVSSFTERIRDVRGLTSPDEIWRDVRLAWRGLRRAPAFVLTVVVCLGLGTGANTAIFSVIDNVLLRPLPYGNPERLVNIYETFTFRGGTGSGSVSYANFLDWSRRSRLIEQMSLTNTASAVITDSGGTPERLIVRTVSPNYFTTLGVKPLLGNAFAPAHGQPGEDGVVMINERLWRSRFGADPTLVGRRIVLDGRPRVVIGIVPASFSATSNVWTPLAPTPQQASNRDNHLFSVSGRLRPGVTVAQARTEMRAIEKELHADHPEIAAGRDVDVHSMREDIVGAIRPTLMILLGAVALVLIIACANVASLLVARAATRRGEVALRLALGASRGRLVRQFLVESLLLAVAGSAVGAGLGWAGLGAIRSLLASGVPRGNDIHVDANVFLFLVATAMVCAILFGVFPALSATRTDLRAHLSDAGNKATTGARHRRLRSALVTAEIALSLVLLVSAGLLLRGVMRLRAVHPGFTADHILTAHLTLPAIADSLSPATRSAAQGQFVQQFLDQVRAIPGVASAGLINLLPIQTAYSNGGYNVVGKPRLPAADQPIAEYRNTSPGFFPTLGIRIIRGRDFTSADALGGAAPVVIVNQSLAQAEFGSADPIGHQLAFDPPATIVGVVGDVRQATLEQPQSFREIHFPMQASNHAQDITLALRTTVPPAAMERALRDVLHRIDPEQALYRVLAMDQVVEDSLGSRRLNLWLFGTFETVALVLSAAGLYGIISYLVAQRTREIGIRMALGAHRGRVVAMVLEQGGRMIASGLALGLVGAWLATRLIRSLLYGVSPHDLPTYAAVTAGLGLVGLIATWIPARRAARIDPLRAIRSE
jgi:putative ABC transport system permease protein